MASPDVEVRRRALPPRNRPFGRAACVAVPLPGPA